MSIRFGKNIVNVPEGGPCFLISTNLVDYFEIGRRGETRFFLEGEIVGPPPEFIFNGVLFIPGQAEPCVIFDKFPRQPPPPGWQRRHRVDNEGYDLINADTKEVVFGYVIKNNVCHITTNLYDDRGQVAAETLEDDFVVRGGPCRLGRGGIVIG